MSIIRRNRSFTLRKRVPRRFQAVESRTIVWLALHTDSEQTAKVKAPTVWAEMLEYWEALLAGDTNDAEKRYQSAQDIAAALGHRYLPSSRVADLPANELLQRIEAVSTSTQGVPENVEAAALLGGVKEPPITITRALELYWGLDKDKTYGKSPDQLRRWKNPRKKAIRNLASVIGDKPIRDITGDDMLDFREWWSERIEIEHLTANSANKDLTHLGSVLKTVNRMKRLNIVLPLSDLSFKEREAKERPPFSTHWIKEKLLAKGALDGLNAEAKAILLGMINTGYRPSEAAALTDEEINLEAPIPYLSFKPIDRHLKTSRSKRVIPLCGVSLEALKPFPNGFPRYKESSAGLSATVNKFLRANNLVESPDHTMYSLRHSFEDRALAAGIDERIRRDLMGHKLDREKYGKGATLEYAYRVVNDISFQ